MHPLATPATVSFLIPGILTVFSFPTNAQSFSNREIIVSPPPSLPSTPQGIRTHLNFPRTLKEANLRPQDLTSSEIPRRFPIVETSVDPEIAQTTNSPTYTAISAQLGGFFTSGPGVGYDSSYFSLEGFVPLGQTLGKNIGYLQGRFTLDTADGNLGGNLLLGYRTFNAKTSTIVGGYLGFDIRDTGRATFSQLGAGIEALALGWEFRLNGYLPVGSRRRQVAEISSTTSNTSTISNTSTSNPRFQGNSLVLDTLTTPQQLLTNTTLTSRLFETSLAGFDAEVGVNLWQWSPVGDLRSYLGLYYYSGSSVAGFVGVRGRLESRLSENLHAGLSIQRDREFGTTAIISLGIHFPGVQSSSNTSPQQLAWAKAGDLVFRQPNVAVAQRTTTNVVTTATPVAGPSTSSTIILLNPATGQPWVFQHVTLGGIAGTGTFENPFNTVASGLTATTASGNEIIYVQAGTDPGIPAFMIPANVQVLSTGPVQQIATNQGTIQLPFSGSGSLPRITGTVTLGNRTTLGGFNITGFVGTGITGNNLSNITIQDNLIANLTGTGINLTGNLTGAIIISRNTITNLTGVGSRGLNLLPNQPVAQPLQITISNNVVNSTAERGMYIVSFGNTTLTATITKNQLINNGAAALLPAGFGNSQIRFVVDSNQISATQFLGPDQQGISAESYQNTQLFLSLTNNQIYNTNAFANFSRMEVRLDNVNATSQLCVQAVNNQTSLSGMQFINLNTGPFQVEPLIGNTGPIQPSIGTITSVAAGTCGF